VESEIANRSGRVLDAQEKILPTTTTTTTTTPSEASQENGLSSGLTATKTYMIV